MYAAVTIIELVVKKKSNIVSIVTGPSDIDCEGVREMISYITTPYRNHDRVIKKSNKNANLIVFFYTPCKC